MTWVLILMIHAGALSHNDDVALQVVPGFSSEATCMAAGAKIKPLDRSTVQNFEFTCVAVK